MCSLAPRAAAPGFGASATAFLDRKRGVVAAAAMAPAATSRHNAGEPTRRARASEASAARGQKRGRHDAFEHVVVDPASSSSALRIRMDKELVAIQGLLKRAKLLPRRSTPPAEKEYGPTLSDAPAAVSSAVKRRASPLKPAATEAAEYAPAKQQLPVMQRAAANKNQIAPEAPNNKQRPAEAAAAKQQQQRPVQRAAAAKTTEVPKKRRRPEEEEKKEPARAIVVWNSTREEFRQMLVEMEKSALPDETVYPEEMAELGIPFEFLITRTWKQAMLDAKKVELVGV